MTELAVALAIGLLPVLAFLAALVGLDSYKLVNPRSVLATIGAGAVAAALALAISLALVHQAGVAPRTLIRWVAPSIEEIAKAAIVVALIRGHRVGFLVDAAIFGFASGAGFALLENVYYVTAFEPLGVGVWIVRGFGTAVMHGGTTTIYALTAKTLADRRETMTPAVFLPGLIPAVAIHLVYNQFWIRPLPAALLVVASLPPIVVLVFRQSERALKRWLGTGFDADAQLLETIRSGEVTTALGGYLRTLRDKFSPEVLVDMLCYLRLHTELALRAKGELMMREHGFASEVEPEVREKFEEMAFLERSIGPTGRLALLPVLHGSSRDLWQLKMLGKR